MNKNILIDIYKKIIELRFSKNSKLLWDFKFYLKELCDTYVITDRLFKFFFALARMIYEEKFMYGPTYTYYTEAILNRFDLELQFTLKTIYNFITTDKLCQFNDWIKLPKYLQMFIGESYLIIVNNK